MERWVTRGRKKLRAIMVDGEPYLWRYSPGYERTGCASEPYRCCDIFTAHRKGQKRNPLRIVFSSWEDPVIGGPLKIGAPLDIGALSDPDGRGANLYTPGIASRLITRARQPVWAPASGVLTVSAAVVLFRS